MVQHEVRHNLIVRRYRFDISPTAELFSNFAMIYHGKSVIRTRRKEWEDVDRGKCMIHFRQDTLQCRQRRLVLITNLVWICNKHDIVFRPTITPG